MTATISRRNLIQGAAGLVVASSALASAALAEEAPALVPGTYTASADGISSAVAVTVTVDDSGVIANIVVDTSGETEDIGAAAAGDLQAQLLAAGSAEIDGVAGATITSGAAKKAMAAALKMAATGEVADAIPAAPAELGDYPAWLGAKPGITDDMCVEIVDCELLIVGSGTAGHFAAMSAVQSGAHPLVIDKAEVGLGIRNQMGAIDTQLMRSAGVHIDRNEIADDLSRYSNYWNDPKLIHLWYDKSGEIFDFYNDLCREGGLRPHLMYFATNENNRLKGFIECNEVIPGEGEPDPAAVVEAYVEGNGGAFRYNTSLVELVQDEAGKVLGIYATNADGDYIRINAEKGVIVATGGYAHNREMMRTLQPQAAKVYAGERAPITNQGDGIKACLWAGAAKDDKTACMLFERAALPLGTTDLQQALENNTHKVFWMGSQPFLTVDLNGERFCNESGCYDQRLHAIAGKGGVMIELIDSNYHHHNMCYDTDGCSRSVPMPLWDGEEMYMKTDTTARRGQFMDDNPEYFAKADTWEELAEQLGVPAEKLVATVERYNELCERGYDEDFGKEPYRMVAYTQPPFYGGYISGLILCTFDGIVTNTKMQALREDGSVIEGLYCAGNDQGRYFCDTYPNLTAGAAGGKTATFGWLAAKVALGEEI